MSHSSGRPNLFIVGAAKSGTSWLHEKLNTHPDIFMSTVKEPSYFIAADQLRSWWPDMYARGYWESEARYLELFGGAVSERIIGESSTPYSMDPVFSGVPERIVEFSPDARILFLMRHPTERAISHYWHHVRRRGLKAAPLDAIHKQPMFLAASYYAHQVSRYLSFFDRQQIHVVSLEQMNSAPLKEMQRIFRWLGIDDNHTPSNLEQREHVTPEVMTGPRSTWMKKLRDSEIGKVLRKHLSPQTIRKFRGITHRQTDRSSIDTKPLEDYLRAIHADQIFELEELLDQRFDEWDVERFDSIKSQTMQCGVSHRQH